MAKGNMILGYLRGAIGDIVFWRAKGQQMARARNRAPANPRTEYQMMQRAKWANVAKFVKMAPPRFFQFAFEGKGLSLTDYNMLYRENILRSPLMSKTASANPAYPALGNFVMSRGSLPSIGAITEYEAVSLDTPFFKLAEGNEIIIPSEQGRTVSWLTNQLLTLSPSRYRVGDILTFVKISCNSFATPLVYPELNDYGYSFQYFQIVLSLTDTTLVKSKLGGYARLNTLGSNKLLGISYGSTSGSTGAVEWSGDLKATCMIHTRNIQGGLLVSGEELTVNGNYASLTNQAQSNSVYIQQVLTDWRSQETAILQGGSLLSVDDDGGYGNYVIGNLFDASTRVVSVGNVTGCSVGDGFSLHLQTDKQLTDEQVKYLLGHSIISSVGLTVNFNASVETEVAPTGYIGYSCNDQITVDSLPATLQFKDETGQLMTVYYTS